MANIDINTPFSPMTPDFLRSAEGKEVPAVGYQPMTGAVYPTEQDLAEFLGQPDGVGATMPDACVIADAPLHDRREILYCRPITLPPRRRDAHVAVVAPTGVGKTTRVIQPLMASELEDPDRSLISFSLKGEEYPLLAAACRRTGAALDYVDLGDPERSLGFNPLATDDPGTAYDVISTFAGLTVKRNSHESEFWKQTGINFMAGAWHCGCRSFAEMLDLFELPRDAVLARLRDAGNPSAQSTHAFIQSNSPNAETTLATVVGWLAPFRDPKVRATTSTHELDASKLFRSRRALAVRCPEARLSTLRPVYNLLLQWLLDAAVSAADEDDGPTPRPSISFYVEDLPAWGPIDNLLDRLTTLRSRRISLTVAIQSMAHLRHAYGQSAEAVEKSFVNKIILGGIDQADAEYFCRCSGEQQVALEDDRGDTLDRDLLTRYVLNAGDIRSPRWIHFLLGQPATFILQDVTFQAYLCPTYLRNDWSELVKAGTEARPPRRSRPLTAPTPLPLSLSRNTFTDTRNMNNEQIHQALQVAKEALDWDNTTGSARKWWDTFESENKHRPAMVLRLAEELVCRKSTVTEFFQAYVYSNTDNIQANLHYHDYTRLKKEEERKKREEAQRAREGETGKKPAGSGRLRSGELCPEGGGGRYEFDGYADEGAGTRGRAMHTVIAVIDGERMPACGRTQRSCWWKNIGS